MQEYIKFIEEKEILESVIPRKFDSEETFRKFCDNL